MWYPPDLSHQLGRPAKSWHRGKTNRQLVTTQWGRDREVLECLTSSAKDDKIPCQDTEGQGTYAYCLELDVEGRMCMGTEHGYICLVNTNNNQGGQLNGRLKEWAAHKNAIYDLKWIDGSKKIVSVGGDNNLCVWDVDQGIFTMVPDLPGKELCRVRPPKVTEHQGCMKCLAVAPGGTLVTGGRDNAIICWDLRVPQPAVLNVVKYSHKPLAKRSAASLSGAGPTKASVTALDFIDDQNVISCSDLDGIIKVWDLRMSYDRYTGVPKCKHSIPYAGNSSLKGYSSLVLDSTKSTAYVSCQDHTIYAFDIGRCDSVLPIKTFHGGHTNGSRFYTKVSISLDDRYLVTGSADNEAYIYSTSTYAPCRPVAKLSGHTNDVTCVAFSKQVADPYKIATTADDFDVRLWRQQRKPTVEHQENVNTTEPRSSLEDGTSEIVGQLSDYLGLCDHYKEDPKLRSSPSREENQENSSPANRHQLPAAKKRRFNPLSETNCHQKLRLEPMPSRSPVKIEISPTKKAFTSRLNVNVTPTKKRKLIFSPTKRVVPESPLASTTPPPWASPTLNLPNLVEDGRSPHHRPKPSTSAIKPRRALDWLSAISKVKQSEAPSPASPSPSKQLKLKGKSTTENKPKTGRKRKRL